MEEYKKKNLEEAEQNQKRLKQQEEENQKKKQLEAEENKKRLRQEEEENQKKKQLEAEEKEKKKIEEEKKIMAQKFELLEAAIKKFESQPVIGQYGHHGIGGPSPQQFYQQPMGPALHQGLGNLSLGNSPCLWPKMFGPTQCRPLSELFNP